jgi:hypothetical protein
MMPVGDRPYDHPGDFGAPTVDGPPAGLDVHAGVIPITQDRHLVFSIHMVGKFRLLSLVVPPAGESATEVPRRACNREITAYH